MVDFPKTGSKKAKNVIIKSRDVIDLDPKSSARVLNGTLEI